MDLLCFYCKYHRHTEIDKIFTSIHCKKEFYPIRIENNGEFACGMFRPNKLRKQYIKEQNEIQQRKEKNKWKK